MESAYAGMLTPFEEVAFGNIGCSGFLTVEREARDNPARDVIIAADFLCDTIKSINV